MKYSRAATLFFDVPLCILPSKRLELEAFWQSKLAGKHIDWEEHAEPFQVQHVDLGDEIDMSGDQQAPRTQNSIAIIPLHGTISQRVNMLSAMSGGTSTEQFASAFREQLNNPRVKAIVMDIDSPGGSSFGVTELANLIMNARGQKPILASINSTGASAAYWIASAADRIFVTPGGIAGSIGVYAVHQDVSQAEANDGIKTTLISAGKNKTRGNPFEPLSEEDHSYIQSLVNDTYDRFIRDVARGRGTSLTSVRNGYGQGDVVTANKALEMGMVDGIQTLEETIQTAATARPRRAAGMHSELPEEEDVDISEPVIESDESITTMGRLRLRHLQAEQARLAPIGG